MEDTLDAFVREAPVAVMVRASLSQALADSTLDELFDRTAQAQYTKELTFSTLVKLMAPVTLGTYTSIHQAYRQARDVPVSITAVYDKLQRLEPAVLQAVVEQTARRLGEIVGALPLPHPPAVADLHVRMLDGNFLAGTDRRLDCLRGSGAAALPGMALVVRDGTTGLLTDILPCEDAYTNERGLHERLLPLVRAGDLWVADRNFCTLDYLGGIAEREGRFLIRHHSGTQLTPLTEGRYVGSNASGDLYEQTVLVSGRLKCRCILVELFEPLRDGSEELRLLTNVPRSKAGAKRLAELYRTRWQIETAFQELTCNLRCEVQTLGYPKAALFAFALALVAYNVVKVVQAALAAGGGPAAEELLSYHLATEMAATGPGMAIALPEPCWARFAAMSTVEFAAWLHETARQVDCKRYRKNKRGPKKPRVVDRTRRGAHRSTARLLEQPTKTP